MFNGIIELFQELFLGSNAVSLMPVLLLIILIVLICK